MNAKTDSKHIWVETKGSDQKELPKNIVVPLHIWYNDSRKFFTIFDFESSNSLNKPNGSINLLPRP